MCDRQTSIQLSNLLERCFELQASDLHITTNTKPAYRVHGGLQYDGDSVLTLDNVQALMAQLFNDYRQQEFTENGQVDFGYSLPDGERFRINAYMELGKPAIAIRHLNNRFKSISDLYLPEQISLVPQFKNGLVLVCGSTGSGKSTTLASILHEINTQRDCHILTIEDPVEFVHKSEKSLVHQRELGADVMSFADSLRAALRQDPDVIMVGEMRDLDTMKAALTAAETGHLVFSTLHTGDAVGVIDRLIGSFPGDEQDVARNRIASALKAVIAQRLIPIEGAQGRMPAAEVLMVTNGVANLIAGGKTSQIYSSMESGKAEGMQTLEQSLLGMVKQRWISAETAMGFSRNPNALEKLIQGRGLGGSASSSVGSTNTGRGSIHGY